MKKILILLATICCLGCSHETDNVKRGETDNVMRGEIHLTNVGSFTYVQYDGHEYLVWINGMHRGGITHSPKCPCQNK